MGTEELRAAAARRLDELCALPEEKRKREREARAETESEKGGRHR